jgi:hypothetical protein
MATKAAARAQKTANKLEHLRHTALVISESDWDFAGPVVCTTYIHKEDAYTPQDPLVLHARRRAAAEQRIEANWQPS